VAAVAAALVVAGVGSSATGSGPGRADCGPFTARGIGYVLGDHGRLACARALVASRRLIRSRGERRPKHYRCTTRLGFRVDATCRRRVDGARRHFAYKREPLYGPPVTVAPITTPSGESWVLSAQRYDYGRGLCVSLGAAPDNAGVSCGFSRSGPEVFDPAPDDEGCGDTFISGPARADVASVSARLVDGGVIRARFYDAPAALRFEGRFFVGATAGVHEIARVRARDRHGKTLDLVQVGPDDVSVKCVPAG
jgi:hypothetical protein